MAFIDTIRDVGRTARPAEPAAVRARREAHRRYIGGLLQWLERNYAADRWDVLMYVATYVLVIILFATG